MVLRFIYISYMEILFNIWVFFLLWLFFIGFVFFNKGRGNVLFLFIFLRFIVYNRFVMNVFEVR